MVGSMIHVWLMFAMFDRGKENTTPRTQRAGHCWDFNLRSLYDMASAFAIALIKSPKLH